jgi:hypothetical protein
MRLKLQRVLFCLEFSSDKSSHTKEIVVAKCGILPYVSGELEREAIV